MMWQAGVLRIVTGGLHWVQQCASIKEEIGM